MPTYDYRCETCGLDFELAQSFHDDTLVKCPTKKSGNNPAGCASPGRGRVAKIFSAPGITFKGSGFYKTDSRSSSKAGSSSGNGDSSSTSKESADTKSGESTSSKTETSTSSKETAASKSKGSAD